MSARKPPLLMLSGLTGRVYIVTAYTDLGEGRIVAKTKFDVTDQYDAIIREASQTSASVDAVPADRQMDPAAQKGPPDLATPGSDNAAGVAGTTGPTP